jgi:cytoskeletal protein CcmA (bactofilin family)
MLAAAEEDDCGGEVEGADQNRYSVYYQAPRTDPAVGGMTYDSWADGQQQLERLRSDLEQSWQPTLHADPTKPCGGLCASPNVCAGNMCYPPCSTGTIITIASPVLAAPSAASGNEYCPTGTLHWQGSLCYCQGAQTGPGGGSGSGSGGALGKCAWTHIGPTNVPGRVLDLAMDKSNSNRIFAATVGGLWRTSDGGRRWERVSDSWWTGKVGAVAVNPTLGSEVMAAGGDPNYNSGTGDGVFLSQTNGDDTSWSQILALPNSFVNQIKFLAGGTKVYVASSAGLHVGTKSGTTWTFSKDTSIAAGGVYSVAIDESTSPETVYATQAGGKVWKKGTAGTWVRADSGVTQAGGRTAIALAPSNLNILYLKVDHGANAGIYRTTTAGEAPDGSTAWSDISSASISVSYNWYLTSYVAIDPVNADHVIVPAVGLWESTNGGTSWSSISGSADTTYPMGIHNDQHALLWDPNNAGRVIVGTDGGVYRQVNANSTWHWEAISHGMTTTEFYYLSTQDATATMATGAFQDNGTWFTFGRRGWYPAEDNDGTYHDVDAVENLRLFTSEQTAVALREWVQPIAYLNIAMDSISGADGRWVLPAGESIHPPVAPDPVKAYDTLATGVKTGSGDYDVLHSIDGKNWASLSFPPGYTIGALPDWGGLTRRAIWVSRTANGSGKRNYYVAATSRGTPADDGGAARTTGIVVSHDGGVSWLIGQGLAVSATPAVAVDPTNADRAVAIARTNWTGLCGSIFISTDGGANWSALTNGGYSGASDDGGTGGPCASPKSAPSGAFTNLAFDPNDTNVVYAAHQHGVFKGTINGTRIDWQPFDEGLPNGVDVNDIRLNQATNELVIGTFGYGAYRRNLDLGTGCAGAQLIVRDHVFDHGDAYPAGGLPDPEHTVKDSAHAGRYTAGGPVYWWESPDIRVDVPSARAYKNKIDTADSVEFDSCPIEASDCPVGTMMDDNAQRGKLANVYAEVTNRGIAPIGNVRVATFFADATLELPPLPADFWTNTLPKGSVNCGVLNASSKLSLIGCTTLPYVDPDVPAVAKFPWNVPATAADHSCAVTFIESADTPLPDDIRSKTRLDEIVPASPLIAQRNLAIINPPSGGSAPTGTGGAQGGGGLPCPGAPDDRPRTSSYTGIAYVNVPNYDTTTVTRDIVFDRSQQYSGRLSFLLPTGWSTTVQGLPPACQVQTAQQSTTPIQIKLPTGSTETSVVAAAQGDLRVEDGARVFASDGTSYGLLTNAGTVETMLGARAEGGTVVSLAPVTLNSYSVVHGSVTAPAISMQAGASVTGGKSIVKNLTANSGPGWVITWPASSNGDIALEPGITAVRAPGPYGRVALKSSSHLTISSGTYFFETLEMEPGSTLEVKATGAPVIIYVRGNSFLRGTILEGTAGGRRLMVVYLGTNTVFVDGALVGTIAAPNTGVVLGQLPSGKRHVGTVMAKDVSLRSGAILQQATFSGWGGLVACAPLSSDEASKAQSLGLDTTIVYGVASGDQTISLSLPASTTIKLGLRYESGEGIVNTADRFRVVYKGDMKVRGGVTYVVRH